MKTLIISLLSLTFISAANAAPKKPCPDLLKELRSGKPQRASVTKTTYMIAKDALAHYRANELGGYTNRPHIESLYKFGADEALTGYKMVLTDGGDESIADYYLNAEGKMVYVKYHNQSPVQFWFCGQKTALEIYE
jgi:hypothetical protein